MALGDKVKEKKKERAQKIIDKYGLDGLNNDKDYENVCRIAYELMGTGAQEFGMTFSMQGKPYEVLPVYYLKALIEQNWIIIRQLDKLNSHFAALGK